MTVNVALVTREALILGCDSIASSTRFLIDPFKDELFAKGENGEPLTDSDGNPLIALKRSSGESFVTNTYNGVSKMFKVYDNGGCIAAAVTAGAGSLKGRSIRNLAAEFCENESRGADPITDLRAVADRYLSFFRRHYEAAHAGSSVPSEYWPDLDFLLGGFGTADPLPSLYRVLVKANLVIPAFGTPGGAATGVAWGGQSDSVERLLNGYDSTVKQAVEHSMTSAFDAYRSELQRVMVNVLEEIHTREGTEIQGEYDLPARPTVNLPWDRGKAGIDYANIPIQDSVNFVAFLVNAESWLQRFRYGIPTVGGRTHVGVLQRDEGVSFTMLNEPTVVHQFTGFDNV